MNELKIFNNNELGISVRTMLNDDGSISINAEDTAIGFGWTKVEVKNGKEYMSVRWDRMNSYSAECGFDHEWSKDDYIPESLYYMLGFKAGNERALKYQKWLAMDVIPQLRRNGTYTMHGKSNVEQGIAKELGIISTEEEYRSIEVLVKEELKARRITNKLYQKTKELLTSIYVEIRYFRVFSWLRTYIASREGIVNE